MVQFLETEGGGHMGQEVPSGQQLLYLEDNVHFASQKLGGMHAIVCFIIP